MPYLILGVGVMIGLYFLARWFVAADPADVRKVVIYGGIGLVLLIAGFLLFTGRAGVAALVLPALVPFLYQLWPRRAGRVSGNGGTRQRTSTVRTRFLDMALHHATGALDGTVIDGRFSGRRMSELSLDDLLALLAETGSDEQSQRILEAYLDRQHGPDWRRRAEAGQHPAGRGNGRMTAEEAREILGVGPEATAEEIDAAYRAAMKRNHPDAGGSSWLAAKINEARALLLG